MTAQEFKAGLVAGTDVPVYHILAAPDEVCPVLCWQEIGIGHTYGDDAPVADIVTIQIDYFTETEYDTYQAALEALLQELGTYFTFNGITYDIDREEWRYIWTVQFLGG